MKKLPGIKWSINDIKKDMALQKIKWYMLFGMILKMVSMMDEANEENKWAPKFRECKRNRK